MDEEVKKGKSKVKKPSKEVRPDRSHGLEENAKPRGISALACVIYYSKRRRLGG
jgi:hypothetical protein